PSKPAWATATSCRCRVTGPPAGPKTCSSPRRASRSGKTGGGAGRGGWRGNRSTGRCWPVTGEKRLAVQAQDHGRALDDVVGAQGADRGADGEELGGVRAPGVAVLAELNGGDALGVQGLGL